MASNADNACAAWATLLFSVEAKAIEMIDLERPGASKALATALVVSITASLARV